MTMIVFKLLPLPKATPSLMVGFSSNGTAVKAVGNVFHAGMLLNVLKFIGKNLVRCSAMLNQYSGRKGLGRFVVQL